MYENRGNNGLSAILYAKHQLHRRNSPPQPPADTLPPYGALVTKPNYVTAGTYLGSNPLHPLTLPWPDFGGSTDNRQLLKKLLLLLYLLRSDSFSRKIISPGLYVKQ